MSASAPQPRRLGMIGSIVGLLALIAAVLPHWVLPAIYPPPPVDKVVVDTGHKIKDRIIARVKGVEYQAPRQEEAPGRRLSFDFSTTAISLGLLAIVLAVFSQIFREEKLLAGVAAALGVASIAFELWFIALGVLLLIAILYVVAQFLSLF